MSAGARALFIYWRVVPGGRDAALSALRQMQDTLRQDHPGLRTACYEREGEPTTLMETYRADGGVGPALAAAIEARMAPALARWTDGARHLEVFTRR